MFVLYPSCDIIENFGIFPLPNHAQGVILEVRKYNIL